MNLFRYIYIALFSLNFHLSIAQNESNNNNSYRFIYKVDYTVDVQKKGAKEDLMCLDIVEGKSEFYSKWARRSQQVRDSLLNLGESLNEILRAESFLPKSTQKDVVYKNIPNKGTLTFTDKMVKDFIYEEQLKTPVWKIVDEKKDILGYNCQKAVTEYYGVQWTVWFSSEIPISEGPWKLHGLPGIILEATDSESYYHFLCVGLENISKEEIVVPKKNYIKCSHKEYIELRKLKTEDLGAFSERISGRRIITNATDQNKKIGKQYIYLENHSSK
ncbi:MAG: GLPGLI family protein [Phocaeicola sp.]